LGKTAGALRLKDYFTDRKGRLELVILDGFLMRSLVTAGNRAGALRLSGDKTIFIKR